MAKPHWLESGVAANPPANGTPLACRMAALNPCAGASLRPGASRQLERQLAQRLAGQLRDRVGEGRGERRQARFEYEPGGNLTVTDSLFSIEAALDGIALAYTFEPLALPHLKAKTLKRVLSSFSPTFPGFYLYYPSRRQQASKLKALVEYALAHYRVS